MTSFSHYEHLRKKWTARHTELSKTLWNKHKESLEWFANNTKQLAAGSLGGLLLLSAPHTPALSAHSVIIANEQVVKDIDKSVFLITDLSSVVPSKVRPLTEIEEQKVSTILSRHFGFRVNSELEGKKLNRSYGLIGQEQHLARYPGDNMYTHFATKEEATEFGSYGMAPGLGAWRYFAPSKAQLSEQDIMREKYYIAVQTFLAKDFNKRFSEYRDFFKFRKMLVVNPENSRAIVAVIGDAGPAVLTGKHLGGSPEVMRYLQRVDGRQRGPVLYFFIDDPGDTVPLGPISVK